MRIVDPEPFEPYLPPSVAALIEQARAGEGPAAAWLHSREAGWGPVGDGFGFLRGHPVRLDPEQVGWLIGITMFCDERQALVRVMERERHRAPAPYAIEAFVAGIRGGAVPVKRQWSAVERLTKMAGRVPDCLLEVVPGGLISDSALERGVALQFARALGEPAITLLQQTLEQTAGKKHQRRLTEALEQLAGSPAETASADGTLRQLLEAWRYSRNSDLAEAIAFYSRTRRSEPLAARSKTELEGAWLALADRHDPGDVERLLGTPWPGAWKDAKKRIEALAGFEPDPRIAAGLMDAAGRYASLGSHPMHVALTRVAEAMGDPRQAEPARMLGAQRYRNQGIYPRLAQKLSARGSRPVPRAVREVVDALLQQRDALQQLWDAVWDEPEDDQRRLVLADALQSLGDPRGELILCQLAEAEGTANAAVRKRIKQLLDENIDAWTGPIPDVKRATRVFEKGFLASVSFDMPGRGGEALAELEAWRTVRHLNVPGGGAHIAPILPRARCLKSLTLGFYGLDYLGEDAGPFPGIEILGVSDTADRRYRAFPDVRVILTRSFDRYDVDPAVVAEEVRRAFALGNEVGLLGATDPRKNRRLLKALGPHPERRVTLFVSSGRASDPLLEPGWRVQIGPETARLGWVGGTWKVDAAVEQLSALKAAGCREVTAHVAGTKKKRAELEAASPVKLTFVAEAFAL